MRAPVLPALYSAPDRLTPARTLVFSEGGCVVGRTIGEILELEFVGEEFDELAELAERPPVQAESATQKMKKNTVTEWDTNAPSPV